LAEGFKASAHCTSEIREARVIRLRIILLASLVATWPLLLAAQLPTQPDNAVQVGDHWTIDTRDEITGTPTDTFIRVVTEVSPNEIVTRVNTRGKNNQGIVVYDRNWDRIENSTWKWKPNDGLGVRFPLAIGKEWRSELEARNTQTGSANKITVLAKITAQETVITPAGTFDTFKIETKWREFVAKDPSRVWDHENVGWYAPQVNYWVRRTFLTRVQKRTTQSTSEELIDFGHKL
jgi:hypothetical protein